MGNIINNNFNFNPQLSFSKGSRSSTSVAPVVVVVDRFLH